MVRTSLIQQSRVVLVTFKIKKLEWLMITSTNRVYCNIFTNHIYNIRIKQKIVELEMDAWEEEIDGRSYLCLISIKAFEQAQWIQVQMSIIREEWFHDFTISRFPLFPRSFAWYRLLQFTIKKNKKNVTFLYDKSNKNVIY